MVTYAGDKNIGLIYRTQEPIEQAQPNLVEVAKVGCGRTGELASYQGLTINYFKAKII
jgi:hypothetical protein